MSPEQCGKSRVVASADELIEELPVRQSRSILKRDPANLQNHLIELAGRHAFILPGRARYQLPIIALR